MSKKRCHSTFALKSLTGISGILGAVFVLSLPAFSQSNTNPNRSSSPASAAGEVCVIPRRTMNADGSNVQSLSGADNTAGTSGNRGGTSAGRTGTSGSTGGSGNTAGTSGSTGGTSAGRTGTSGSTGGSGNTAGTSGSTGGTSAGRMGTTNNADMSVTMMEGIIVCGTPTTPNGTNR